MVLRKIVKIDEIRCNGCGNCIPKCAEGALKITDGKARIVSEVYCDGLGACLGHCPQDAITIIEREAPDFSEEAVKHYRNETKLETEEQKTVQWPVKINLVPLKAPFYENANLLIAADCAPLAYAGFRSSLMAGKRVIIGCSKFDDVRTYAQKLSEILRQNNIATIAVAHMEVPCCSGLNWAVGKAMEASGKKIPVKRYEITVRGEVNEL